MCSWSVGREFLDAQDGGGSSAITVSRASLMQHRNNRRRAELDRRGKPVPVHYVQIPFEMLVTTDVVECFVRRVARTTHCSYAEAEIDARCIGSPDYFVSHAWNNLFVELVESLLGDLAGAALDDTYVWLDIFAINQVRG